MAYQFQTWWPEKVSQLEAKKKIQERETFLAAGFENGTLSKIANFTY